MRDIIYYCPSVRGMSDLEVLFPIDDPPPYSEDDDEEDEDDKDEDKPDNQETVTR